MKLTYCDLQARINNYCNNTDKIHLTERHPLYHFMGKSYPPKNGMYHKMGKIYPPKN